MIRFTSSLSSKLLKKTSNSAMRPSLLNHTSKRTISSLQIYLPGVIFNKLKKFFLSRAGLYRILSIGIGVHLGLIMLNSNIFQFEPVMPVSDYLDSSDLIPDQLYQLYGIVKPGSIKYDSKRNSYKFK